MSTKTQLYRCHVSPYCMDLNISQSLFYNILWFMLSNFWNNTQSTCKNSVLHVCIYSRCVTSILPLINIFFPSLFTFTITPFPSCPPLSVLVPHSPSTPTYVLLFPCVLDVGSHIELDMQWF